MFIAPDVAAPPEKIRALIDQLLDEKALRDALKRVFVHERVRQIQSNSEKKPHNWLLAPLAERDGCRELPNLQLVIEAADCPDFAQAEKILQRCQWDHLPYQGAFVMGYPNTTIPRYSRWFYDGYDFSPHIQRGFLVLAERRLTAVALACQLYRLDHGEFPKTLEQLVPAYLRALPSDPFFADGRPIGYSIKTHAPPLSGPRPMLYYDPGGFDLAPRAEPIHGWYGRLSAGPPIRQYRDISRFTAPLLKKTVNKNPYQSYAPGNNSQEDNRSPQPYGK
jgi:hypothetical protein